MGAVRGKGGGRWPKGLDADHLKRRAPPEPVPIECWQEKASKTCMSGPIPRFLGQMAGCPEMRAACTLLLVGVHDDSPERETSKAHAPAHATDDAQEGASTEAPRCRGRAYLSASLAGIPRMKRWANWEAGLVRTVQTDDKKAVSVAQRRRGQCRRWSIRAIRERRQHEDVGDHGRGANENGRDYGSASPNRKLARVAWRTDARISSRPKHGGTRLQLAVACGQQINSPQYRARNVAAPVPRRLFKSRRNCSRASVVAMADPSREHNASPMPGVHPNPDPALDISNEHHHVHKNHSAFAEKGRSDEVVYATGTTPERGVIPPAIHPDELHHRRPADHDIEKTGAYYEAENGSLDKDSPQSEDKEARDEALKERFGLFFHVIVFWRRWGRILVHIFIAKLMTG